MIMSDDYTHTILIKGIITLLFLDWKIDIVLYLDVLEQAF